MNWQDITPKSHEKAGYSETRFTLDLEWTTAKLYISTLHPTAEWWMDCPPFGKRIDLDMDWRYFPAARAKAKALSEIEGYLDGACKAVVKLILESK